MLSADRFLNRRDLESFFVKARPMLLESAADPFDNSDFIFEWKVDGVRCLAAVTAGLVRLKSRSGRDCTAAFPELIELENLLQGQTAVLDGELCVFVQGRPDFEAVMKRYLTGKSRITNRAIELPCNYLVWDILFFQGDDITVWPLARRRKLLESVFSFNGSQVVRVLDAVKKEGKAFFSAIQEQGLEGMVAKRLSGRYYPGRRSPDWLKVKNLRQEEYLITGYSLKGPGTIYLGEAIGQEVRSVGTVQRGLGPLEKAALEEIGRQIEYGRRGKEVRLQPLLKCLVRHSGRTARGNLREPVFVKFSSV